MNAMLPLLLSELGEDSSDSLKTLLMFQMMSEGGAGLEMGNVLPYLMMDTDDDMSETMKLVLLSSMTAGPSSGGIFL